MRRFPTRSARCSAVTLAALAAWSLPLAGCGENLPSDPSWPEGALLVARSAALEELLERLEQLEATPLARRARALATGLPACDTVEGQAENGDLADAASRLVCRPDPSPLELLHRERGDRDLAFVLPLAGGGRLIGTLAIEEAGDLDLALSLPADAFSDARRMLLPGEKAPGSGVLSSVDALLHARLRPDGGLDLASLVPEHGQAAHLFRLKSELFSGVVLDGTWEVAIYLPNEDHAMPPAALALGFTRRPPAIAAMESFVGEIRETWPVRRSFFSVGGAQGACLLDLTLLPELAPCYVATERALVVGWNPASLRKALDGGGERGPGPGGGAVVELARFSLADARLAARVPEDERAPALSWPWRQLRVDGVREGDSVQLHVVLEGETGA